MQKTFCSQTAKLLAIIAENMPEMSGDVMQKWIENPASLKKILKSLSLADIVPKGYLRLVGEDIIAGGSGFDVVHKLFSIHNPIVRFVYIDDLSDILKNSQRRVPYAKVVIHSLEEALDEKTLLGELGEEQGQVSILHLYELLCKRGWMPVDGKTTIFHIAGVSGKLWVINIRWDESPYDRNCYGWHVYGNLAARDNNIWPKGSRVVSYAK